MRRHPVRLATAISALLSAVYLIWQPQTLDLSAQVFRAELWERDGWVLWSDAWYSGFTVPGYSLLYPPLGAWLGPELLGVICAVAAAALFAVVASRAYGERAWLGCAWFGAASTVALYGGRITFALGLALGLAAVWAMQREKPALGALAGFLAGLASPVAGLFTALAAGAAGAAGIVGRVRVEGSEREAGESPKVAIGRKGTYLVPNLPIGWRRAAFAVLIAASASTLLPSLLFPTDGYQPFALSAFVPVVLIAGAALALLPRDERTLRIGVALYAALVLVAFVFDTPLGGNAVRLGATFAGPLIALALFGRRPMVLALVALPLVWWQWTATVRDVAAAEGDPATEFAYFEPLIDELSTLPGVGRIDIPPTRNRWESAYVAGRIPLARGWLRQLESEDTELFTGGNLEPATYAQWLYRHGVSHVAVPDAELDYLAVDEVRLIEEDDLPFLREVWSDEHWRLFEVRATDGSEAPSRDALASGGAFVQRGDQNGFNVRVPGPGEYLLNMRYSPYFAVEQGNACLEDAGDASTRLTVEGAGLQEIDVDARFSLDGLLRRDRVCSD